ncbi:hypothetical protein RUMCAL_00431 [Ruminococcus callidus ATCC 27760]|uniref:Uncharacterized protein n=1 Tax=Ruminococcus callidus ATCC 27760 TaxID=411473 RepID=U2KF95_9FIRM|nr:hypothetical protein RUMCAL_00431 [Ruminococcus callidus ATCC 27760]
MKSEAKGKDFSENPSTVCGGPPFLFKGGRKKKPIKKSPQHSPLNSREM